MSSQAGNRLAILSLLFLVSATSRPFGVPNDQKARRSKPHTDSEKLDPTLTVRVYDFAHLPDALASAEEVASRIFRQAGIEVVWHACLPTVPENLDDPACVSGGESANVMLRIVLERKLAIGVTHDTLGFAAGSYATVSLARVTDLALEQGQPPFLILGRAMAHEIGHVLLGTASHSREGIMRADWGAEELKVAAMNDMFFTRKQSDLLRAKISTATAQQQAAAAAAVRAHQ